MLFMYSLFKYSIILRNIIKIAKLSLSIWQKLCKSKKWEIIMCYILI